MKRAALIVLVLVAVGIVSLRFSSFVQSTEAWQQQPAAREILQVAASIGRHVLPKDSNAMPTTMHIPHEIHRLPVKGYVNAVAWNVDGTRLAALSNFGSAVTVWETKTWAVLKEYLRYNGASYAFNSLAFLPDGALLTSSPIGDFSANTPVTAAQVQTLETFSLIQWNPETGKPVQYFPDLGHSSKDLSNKVTDTFAVSADGSMVAGIHGDVLIYDVKTGTLLRRIAVPSLPKHGDTAASVAFSPNGQELAVGTGFGWVRFFSVRTGALIQSIDAYPEEYSCSALAYSPDGQRIAVGKTKGINVSNPNDISTTVWRVRTGALVASLAGSTWRFRGKQEAMPVRTLAWSPVGNVIAVGDDGSLRLWQVDHATPTLLLDVEKPGTFSVSYSPQGVLAVARKNEVLIYE